MDCIAAQRCLHQQTGGKGLAAGADVQRAPSHDLCGIFNLCFVLFCPASPCLLGVSEAGGVLYLTWQHRRTPKVRAARGSVAEENWGRAGVLGCMMRAGARRARMREGGRRCWTWFPLGRLLCDIVEARLWRVRGEMGVRAYDAGRAGAVCSVSPW